MSTNWHHLPLEEGRHYEDTKGRRVIITRITKAGLADADILDHKTGRTHYDTYYVETGTSFVSVDNPRIKGYWTGPTGVKPKQAPQEPECRCSSKALFSYGHEHGCEWVKHKGEHRR